MKKLNAFLNVVIASFFGSFVGVTIANYIDYRTILKYMKSIRHLGTATVPCHASLYLLWSP